MTTESVDPKELAARAALLGDLQRAADDPEQTARLATMCEALTTVLGALSESLMTARVRFHLQGLTTLELPKIEQGQFLGLSLLAGTGASLSSGFVALIDSGNLYAASALLRQIVEIEYLAWAFANDPYEVVDWYSSNHDDRLKRWQPRHLRDRSQGKFRGKDYAEHCETGGHPTPNGMRNLLQGDQSRIANTLRHELANHGSSAWKYLLDAVAAICEEHGVDPLGIIPGPEAVAVIDAEADWREHETVGPKWAEFNEARDAGFRTE